MSLSFPRIMIYKQLHNWAIFINNYSAEPQVSSGQRLWSSWAMLGTDKQQTKGQKIGHHGQPYLQVLSYFWAIFCKNNHSAEAVSRGCGRPALCCGPTNSGRRGAHQRTNSTAPQSYHIGRNVYISSKNYQAFSSLKEVKTLIQITKSYLYTNGKK